MTVGDVTTTQRTADQTKEFSFHTDTRKDKVETKMNLERIALVEEIY